MHETATTLEDVFETSRAGLGFRIRRLDEEAERGAVAMLDPELAAPASDATLETIDDTELISFRLAKDTVAPDDEGCRVLVTAYSETLDWHCLGIITNVHLTAGGCTVQVRCRAREAWSPRRRLPRVRLSPGDSPAVSLTPLLGSGASAASSRIPGTLVDLGEGGVAVATGTGAVDALARHDRYLVFVHGPSGRPEEGFHCIARLRHQRRDPGDRVIVGLEFDHDDESHLAALVSAQVARYVVLMQGRAA